MGRPRKFESNRAMDKISAAIRDSKSANYTDGYLDGARDAYTLGYDTGYADASTGQPHRVTRRSAKRGD